MTMYDRIAVEDLRIRNMVKNHHLSKSILDAGWGLFAAHLTMAEDPRCPQCPTPPEDPPEGAS